MSSWMDFRRNIEQFQDQVAPGKVNVLVNSSQPRRESAEAGTAVAILPKVDALTPDVTTIDQMNRV